MRRGDWDTAIGLVSARAECYSTDYRAHDDHLRHMDLLVDAGRLEELERLARTDVHAGRRLNRTLRERGMAPELRARAADGDRGALYALVRLLGETGRAGEARQAVRELDPENRYAHGLLAGPRPPDGVDEGAQ
ncbi:hypothetical protein [Kitasatospora phosalacinea]|uniref:hypothetical protein n=1 Tax=Kitasatospora phosalacinea TaxID=2065 RepID=UPI00052752A7|nr:hypothetical protein [Kitasatospora phosalacinea]